MLRTSGLIHRLVQLCRSLPCGLTFAFAAGVAHWTAAQLPNFELQTLSQPLLSHGSTCEMTLAGAQTDEVHQLHFSVPGISAEPLGDLPVTAAETPGVSRKFLVRVEASAPLGLCEVRGVGRFGLSNPRRLGITSKAVVVHASDHSYAAAAIAMSDQQIVVARCAPRQRNFYQLHLPAGHNLQLTLHARTLDSRATPVVVLQSADGQELARGRCLADWPARLTYHASRDTQCLLAVYDAIYEGGPEYPYALEYNTHAAADPPPPLELDQWLSPGWGKPASGHVDVVRVVAAGYQPPATTSPISETASLPLHVQGVFAADGSPSAVEFDAQQGERWLLNVLSHGVGQLTDPRLVLERRLSAAPALAAHEPASPPSTAPEPPASWQQVLNVDDPAEIVDAAGAVRISPRDPQTVWSVAESGRYRVVLQDNESGPRNEDQRRYTLEIRPPQPDFQLLVYPPFPSNQPPTWRPVAANLLLGGQTALRVLAVRREGFDQPIVVQARGLPAGVTAEPIRLHPTQTVANLVVHCDPQAQAWCGPIEIVGTTAAHPERHQLATAATLNWPSLATRNAVLPRLCDALWLCVNPLDTAPMTVAVGTPQVVEVKQGDKLSVPVQLTRRDGGGAACVIRPQYLIPKVSVPELTIAAESSEGQWEVSVAADAPLGEFTLGGQVETKVKWRNNPQALARAEQALSDRQAALAAAQEPAQQVQLKADIEALTSRIETLKTATAEKELTVFLPTSGQTIRIVAP